MSNKYNDLDRVWSDRTFKAYAHLTDHPWQLALGGIGAVIALILILNALSVVTPFWSAEKAKLTVNPRVEKATYGTNNALAYLAYFHDQCNTILADEQNVVNEDSTLKADRETFNNATDPIAQQQASTALSQDQTALIGAKDQLSTDVRDYDSKSATKTAAPFKAANLPYRINVNTSTGKLNQSINCH